MEKREEYEYKPVAGNEEDGAVYDAENGNVTINTAMTMSSEKSDGTSNRKFLYIAACIGNLTAFVCGTAFGWTSPVLPKLAGTPENGNPLPEKLTISQQSWVGSLLPVGATIGPFAAGIAADKIGRKNTLLAGTVPFVIAFAMAAFGTSPGVFFAMRFLCGLAVGSIFTVLPMYIGEISEDEVRGSLGSFMQLFITIGLLFSFVVGPYVSVCAFNIICVITPIAFLIIFFMFIPESPYYLIRSSKKEAEDALMKLRSKPREAIKQEVDKIEGIIEESMKNKASFMDIFKSKGLTKALILSVSLVTFQQFSGINIVLFYAEDIFKDAKSNVEPAISTIILGVVQVLASCATPVVVDKRGKRFLLLLSGIGMAVSLGSLSYFFYLVGNDRDVSSITWLPIASLIIYMITYCLGFGPLPWAVMGELFPDNIKSSASTVTAAFCWFLGFIITKYFSLVSESIGKSGSFGIFSICCVVASLYVYKFLPETSGKSLQEIQDILSGNNKK